MLRTLAFLVLISFALVGAVASPFYGLLAYLWFAIFRPQEWIWLDITAFRFSLVLGILLLGRSLAAGVLPRVDHPIALGIIGYWLLALVAQSGAVNPDVGWAWLDYLARLVLVTLFLARLVDDPKKFTMTIAVIAASFGFHTAKAGVSFLLSGGARFSDGLSGAFIDNNGYALGAVMILPFLWATSQNAGLFDGRLGTIARSFWLAVPLTMLTVIGTFSRAGLLAMLAASTVFVALQRRRLLTFSLAAILLLVAAPFVSLPEGYTDRMETIRTYDEVGDRSALSRLHFWAVAAEIASDRPLGIGLRNFSHVYNRYDTTHGQFGVSRSVHSSHFQVLAETGYLGALLWIALFAESFRRCLAIRRRAKLPTQDPQTSQFLRTMSAALMVSMVGFIVGGAFIELALNDFTWLTFGLVIALDTISLKTAAFAPTPAPRAVTVRTGRKTPLFGIRRSSVAQKDPHS